MKFTINREVLLRPLQLVAGVVERKQTLPVLSNVLIVLEGNQLSLTGTDLEVELVGHVTLEDISNAKDGSITVPARKLMDICKSLSDNASISFDYADDKVKVVSGRSRFTLSTLPAGDFPRIKEEPDALSIQIEQHQLRRLIDRTAFAMAQQDVRYYLNGMLLEIKQGRLRAVATDGHRLALCTVDTQTVSENQLQVIVPRKGIMEMARLLLDSDQQVALSFGTNHVRAETGDFIFTSKLVDGKFPDYERVIPRGGDKVILGDKQKLKQAFQRASILSNEKFRGVRLSVFNDLLEIHANNPEQEEAKEDVNVSYQYDPLEIGFNVSYLLDVLSVIPGESVEIKLSDPNSSALIEETDSSDITYVVMPMRL